MYRQILAKVVKRRGDAYRVLQTDFGYLTINVHSSVGMICLISKTNCTV